jgi:hypothetical protein
MACAAALGLTHAFPLDALAMPSWLIAAFLGLGLAAAAGLRTFLPLLLLALAARFFGLGINQHFSWIGSTPMLVGLAVATAAELAADKIPGVDHGLSLLGTVTRPLAGALAAGAVFAHVDPGVAALAGLIIGVPTALAVHGVQTSARLASTATTAGLGNPVLSLTEDATSGLLAVLAIAAPVIGAIAVIVLASLGVVLLLRLRRIAMSRRVRP